ADAGVDAAPPQWLRKDHITWQAELRYQQSAVPDFVWAMERANPREAGFNAQAALACQTARPACNRSAVRQCGTARSGTTACLRSNHQMPQYFCASQPSKQAAWL